MSQTAKSARDAMKAKAKRLASADPHTKVDSSTWSPAEPLNADIKTGMRPLSRRAFKKGGKVIGKAEGEKAKHRSDRAPRASGGKLAKYIKGAVKNLGDNEYSEGYRSGQQSVAETYALPGEAEEGGNPIQMKNRSKGIDLALKKMTGKAKVPARASGGKIGKESSDRSKRYLTPDNLLNRDQKMANEAREGIKHVGGLKHGGPAKKNKGGSTYGVSTPLRLKKTVTGSNPAKSAKVYKDQDWGEYRVKHFLDGKHQKDADYHTDDMSDAHDTAMDFVNKKHGGKIKKFGGGDIVGDNPVSVQNRSMGKAAGVMKKGGRAKYATDGKVDDAKAKKPINWSQAEEGYKAPAQENTGQDPNFRPASAESQEKLANLAKYGSMKGNPTKSPDYPDARKKGGKVKNWEGSKKDEAQDRMLAKKYGISMEKWEKSEKDKKHDKQQSMKGLKEGGRTAKYSGGGVFSGESYPGKVPGATGGRNAHAKGGKAGKGKTNINIVIASGPPKGEGMMPNAPVPAPKAMPVPPPAAGMPMMPPPGMAPAGGPPVPPPGMMPRKNGGRTIHVIDHAAGGGLGRLEKIKAYGLKLPK